MRVNQRGDVAGVVIGVIISFLVAVPAAALLIKTNVLTLGFRTNSVTMASLADLRTRTTSETDNAESVFIPAKDIFGAANTIAFASACGVNGWVCMPGGATYTDVGNAGGHEFDIMSRDLFGSPHFIAYYYTGGNLSRYEYLARSASGVALCAASTACSGTLQPTSTLSVPRGFTVAYLKASSLPSIDPGLASVPIHDVTLPDGFSNDVISGNQLVVYAVDASTNAHAKAFNLLDQVRLVAGAPLAASIRSQVVYTPPPTGGMSLVSSPNPIILGYGGAQGLPSTGSFQASVTNYHHDFMVGGTQFGNDAATSVPCGSVATAALQQQTQSPSGSANSPPSSFGGTWMNVTVTPTEVGSCTIPIATLTGLLAPDDIVKSGAINVVVEGAISVSPNPLSFAVASGTQSVTVSEPGFTGTFAITSDACGAGGYATTTGSGATSGPIASRAATYSVTARNDTAALPGKVCNVTFADGFGTTGALAVQIDPPPAPTPTPAPCSQIGDTCSFIIPDSFNDIYCDNGSHEAGGSSTTYVASLAGGRVPVDATANATLSDANPDYMLTRTGSGPITVYLNTTHQTMSARTGPMGVFLCKLSEQTFGSGVLLTF